MKFDSLVENILKPTTYIIISGLHGDEPAGNLAANYFKNHPKFIIFSNLNKTHKRRIDGKDPNRHFDDKNNNNLQNNLLKKIEKIKPTLVISLHEDDEVEGLYAYCSLNLKDKVAQALSNGGIQLANVAHGDETDKGVIVNGNQPYDGTLEKSLKKRNIDYCTIETPSKTKKINDRVNCMIKVINNLINL